MARMVSSLGMLAIDARDVEKTFRSGWPRRRETQALRGVSLTVERGAIVGVLGPNGAGKTTLLSILATLLTPDRGTVMVLGLDVVREAGALRRRLNMASGRPSFLWSLRVAEIVAFYGRLYGLSGAALHRRVDGLIELCEPGTGAVAGRRSGRSSVRRGRRVGRVHGGRGREAAAGAAPRAVRRRRRHPQRAGARAGARGGLR